MAKKIKAQRSKPAAQKATSTPVGRQNVILERIEEQMRVVAEGVIMNREAVERRIDELDVKLTSKIGALGVAVRKNSADIQKNSADIQGLAEKLDTKADESRLTALEARVEEALESPVA